MCALWTFKQHLALKCEHFVEFLFFWCKRLCTRSFRIHCFRNFAEHFITSNYRKTGLNRVWMWSYNIHTYFPIIASNGFLLKYDFKKSSMLFTWTVGFDAHLTVITTTRTRISSVLRRRVTTWPWPCCDAIITRHWASAPLTPWCPASMNC